MNIEHKHDSCSVTVATATAAAAITKKTTIKMAMEMELCAWNARRKSFADSEIELLWWLLKHWFRANQKFAAENFSIESFICI